MGSFQSKIDRTRVQEVTSSICVAIFRPESFPWRLRCGGTCAQMASHAWLACLLCTNWWRNNFFSWIIPPSALTCKHVQFGSLKLKWKFNENKSHDLRKQIDTESCLRSKLATLRTLHTRYRLVGCVACAIKCLQIVGRKRLSCDIMAVAKLMSRAFAWLRVSLFHVDDLIPNESIRCRVSEKISRKNNNFDDASLGSSLKVIDHASRRSRRVYGGFYFQTLSSTKA